MLCLLSQDDDGAGGGCYQSTCLQDRLDGSREATINPGTEVGRWSTVRFIQERAYSLGQPAVPAVRLGPPPRRRVTATPPIASPQIPWLCIVTGSLTSYRALVLQAIEFRLA